ncbi:MAG: MATE family efflux transporter [Bacteroidales bacterium]|nr:MATE family efflux transporter [Bacteroidales bacterium]MDE7071882.1 MATE family efflux transporter [Bacteroidales bacterium]
MNNANVATGLDYANGRIPYLFGKIFFPTLLGLIFNALITVIDGIFVGQGVGPDGIAAVNIIAPLYMVVTGIGLMFGIGSSVVSGIAMSQGENRRASVNMTQAMMMSGLLVASLSLLLVFFPESAARLLGSSDRLLSHTLNYLVWLVPGIFFLLFESIGMMVIRLDGSPKYAMLCNIIPAIINIFLDWYFVFPLGMGVKGAAIATSASILVGAVMVMIYFLRFSYVIRFCWELHGFLANTWHQIRVGSSAFVTEIAMSVMMFTGNSVFMRYFGEEGVAAYSIACYLFPLIFMMSTAVAQSSQPIISFNYGAGNTGRVRAAFRVSFLTALICGIITTVSIGLGARGIVAMFINPACEAGVLASRGLPVFALCTVFFSVNMAVIGFCQSVEQAAKALVLTLLRGVIYLVPLFFLVPVLIPGWGVWAAIPCSEILTSVTIGVAIVISRYRGKKPYRPHGNHAADI